MPADTIRPVIVTLCLLIAGGCDKPPPVTDALPSEEIFRCVERLIGLDTVYCHEDVTGPGVLAVRILPDPVETSWELAIRGLAALAETCEFRGHFDRTRLSALQGRGEVELVCPVAAGVNRQYHELRFENRIDVPGTSIAITVTLSR